MLVCVVSMISAIVAPALPMIIPGTTEGTKNFRKASSSGGGRRETEEGLFQLEYSKTPNKSTP